MPYTRKKTYRKKRRSNKAVSALRTLAYRSKIAQKLSQISTCSIFNKIQKVANFDADPRGAIELSDNGTILPLIVIPVFQYTSNDGNAGSGILQLKNNGYDFTQVADTAPVFAGASGNVYSLPAADCCFQKLLCRYTSMKIMFHQHDVQDLTWTVKLIKLKDVDLDPRILTVTETNQVNKRKTFWFYEQLRAQLAHPLLNNSENFTQDLKDAYTTVWEKQYHLQEQSSVHDTASFKEVKFFKKWDKIIDLVTDPAVTVDTTANARDPSKVYYPDYSSTIVQAEPDIPQQLFFLISVNCTKSSVDSSGEYTKAMLDLVYKQKYTLPCDKLY